MSRFGREASGKKSVRDETAIFVCKNFEGLLNDKEHGFRRKTLRNFLKKIEEQMSCDPKVRDAFLLPHLVDAKARIELTGKGLCYGGYDEVPIGFTVDMSREELQEADRALSETIRLIQEKPFSLFEANLKKNFECRCGDCKSLVALAFAMYQRFQPEPIQKEISACLGKGNFVQAYRLGKIYLSLEARKLRNTSPSLRKVVPYIVCKFCEKEAARKRLKQTFCSKKCQKAAWEKENRRLTRNSFAPSVSRPRERTPSPRAGK